MPIPSPNQLSSQYELQNFLHSSDYDDTHSPFVLTSEQQQTNTLTPNPSPESMVDKVVNAGEQISPGEIGSVKDASVKLISDDEMKEKLLHMKAEMEKSLSLPLQGIGDTTKMATTTPPPPFAVPDASANANTIDISAIKTEHIQSSDMDMELDGSQMNDTNFLNTAIEFSKIFGESSEDNENETKMSFESAEAHSKKSDGDRKEPEGKNLNESSDSDSDDTDDDSDDTDDSDDDER